jgi:hypothetical protein
MSPKADVADRLAQAATIRLMPVRGRIIDGPQ